MATTLADSTLLDGLTEPALIASEGRVVCANAAARDLFGEHIEGDPIASVVAHPAALETLDGKEGDAEVELTGLGGSRPPPRFRSPPARRPPPTSRMRQRKRGARSKAPPTSSRASRCRPTPAI
jgi:hypothetical protein